MRSPFSAGDRKEFKLFFLRFLANNVCRYTTNEYTSTKTLFMKETVWKKLKMPLTTFLDNFFD